ncbi:HAMP domain-containing histidine kinase [bacterium]|nr:HAMP domain-containing histidine kinase [bacterium]
MGPVKNRVIVIDKLKQFTDIGVENYDSHQTVRHIRLTNILALTFILVCSSFIPVFLYFKAWVLVASEIFLITCFAYAIYLNAVQHILQSKAVLLISTNTLMLIYSVGVGQNVELGFFACTIFPFVVYENKQPKTQWLLSSFGFAGYMISQLLGPIFQVEFSELTFQSDIYPAMNIFFSFLVVAVCGWFLTKESKDAETELQDEIDKTTTLLSLVCHDIGNPLMVCTSKSKRIKEALTTIEDGSYSDDVTDKLLKNVNSCLKAQDVISELISSVREMQASKTGKKRIKLTNININDVIEQARFIFETRMKEKKITMEFENSLSGEFELIADELSLSNSVVNNIVSNAIKFSTRGGKIVIKASENLDKILLSITDNGYGIPENLVDKLFESNQATSRKGTDGEAGTGFGLPLVKSFMDSYRGEVIVTSRPIEKHPSNHGSTFTLIFEKVRKGNKVSKAPAKRA